ncbi:MAG: DinB family protein [Balneola sp.]
MRKINYSIFTLCLLVLIAFAVANDKKPVERTSYEYLDQELTNAKEFTLEVMNGMPAEDYSFKPVEDVRSFGAQAFHIAYSLEWYNAQLKGKPIAWEPGDENRMSKEELVAYTTEQFDAFIEIVHNAEENGRFTSGVLGALRHNSHHRGQMVTYYRSNGMTPPAYR